MGWIGLYIVRYLLKKLVVSKHNISRCRELSGVSAAVKPSLTAVQASLVLLLIFPGYAASTMLRCVGFSSIGPIAGGSPVRVCVNHLREDRLHSFGLPIDSRGNVVVQHVAKCSTARLWGVGGESHHTSGL